MATLYEIYQKQNKPLPGTVDSRFADPSFASAAQQAGITKDQYRINAGNADYNTRIANLYGKTPVQTPAPVAPQPQAALPQTNTQTTTPTVAPTNRLSYQRSQSEIDFENAQKMAADYYGANANSVIDEEQIRRDALAQMQAEIDATNRVYADKLQRAQVQGTGRLGTSSAISSRRGLLGSDFGEAQYQNVEGANQEIYGSIENEKVAAVSALINKAKESGTAAIAAKRAAKEAGITEYVKSLSTAADSSKKRAGDLAKQILLSKLGIEQYDKASLEEAAKSAGVSVDEIIKQYNELKTSQDVENKKLSDIAAQQEFENKLKTDTLNRPVSLSEGGALIDPLTGKVIASRAKTYAPKAGSGSSSSGSAGTTLDGKKLSPSAQNIVNLVMAGSGTIDDYVKGTSNAAQALRNEVLSGLQATKGKSDKDIENIRDAKAIAQEMINKEDYNKFGYSAKTGGQFTTGFGDMRTRALQMNALLAKDNLGLLKGAMSDKDLAFIEAMSGGVGSDIVISEDYAKQRMQSIVEKLDEKLKNIGQTTTPASKATSGTITAPDGQEIQIID